jgi:hypothetical protein
LNEDVAEATRIDNPAWINLPAREPTMTKNTLFANRRNLVAAMWVCVGMVYMSVAAGLASADDLKTETPARSQYQMSEALWFYNYVIQLERDSHLNHELEVVDYQQQQLKSLKDEMQPQYDELMKKYRQAFTKGNYQQARDVYTNEVNSYKETYAERVKDLLLPHQVKRIEQIIRQQKSRYSRGSSSSYYGRRDDLDLPVLLAEELDLSDAQLEKLKESVEKNRKEMEEEIERIKEKALQDVLKSLPSRKRREFSELVGEPYDFAGAQKARSERYQEEARKRREAQEK